MAVRFRKEPGRLVRLLNNQAAKSRYLDAGPTGTNVNDVAVVLIEE